MAQPISIELNMGNQESTPWKIEAAIQINLSAVATWYVFDFIRNEDSLFTMIRINGILFSMKSKGLEISILRKNFEKFYT